MNTRNGNPTGLFGCRESVGKETKNIGDLPLDSDFWNAGSSVHPKDRGVFVDSKENKLGPKI